MTAPQHMDDHSLRVTFWTASAITFIALLLALYFARTEGEPGEIESPSLEISAP
jgi:hypothetical protein